MTDQPTKKYEFVEGDTIRHRGRILRRIRALRDLPDFGYRYRNVEKGMLGGYIEKEENLSQEGNCWVELFGKIKGNARVFDDAYVCDGVVEGSAKVYGKAVIDFDAMIVEEAEVFDNCHVESALIGGNSKLSGSSLVTTEDRYTFQCMGSYESLKKYEFVEGDTIKHKGRTLARIRAVRDFGCVKKGDLGGYIELPKNLNIYGNCWVYDNAKVFDDAEVIDDASVFQDAEAYGEALISHKAKIGGSAKIFDKASIIGDVVILGCSEVCGKTIIDNNRWIY